MSPTEQPKVEYRQLGKCGLRVSLPILGAMTFGSSKWLPWVLEEQQALPLLKAAWDRGVTTIDTANAYSNGESERIIGTFMKKYNIPREKLVIMTKCITYVADDVSTHSYLMPGFENQRDYINQGGLSRTAIFNAVDASLARLGTSYLDVLFIHRYDPTTSPEEVMKALHDLVTSGKVRYIGASSMRTWHFAQLNHVAELRGWTKFVCMQPEYSLLYREEEREMIPYCKANGIGIVPYSPQAGGALTHPLGSETKRVASTKGTPFEPQHTAGDKKIIQRVEEIAKRHGWTMSMVALAWIAAKATSPIAGISSTERLQEALISGKNLSEKEIEYLEEPYEPKNPRPVPE